MLGSSWNCHVSFAVVWQIFHNKKIPDFVAVVMTSNRMLAKAQQEYRCIVGRLCIFICLCLQIFKKSPRLFFSLSLTRKYLSSVITYSLMYNTLAGVGGGVRWRAWRQSWGGINAQPCIFFLSLFSAEPHSRRLWHTYLILGGRIVKSPMHNEGGYFSSHK